MNQNKYLYWVDGNASESAVYLPMTSTDSVHQVLTSIGNGKFLIANTKNANPYYPLSNNNGTGISGSLAPTDTLTEQSWITFVEADSSNVAILLANHKKEPAIITLLDSLKDLRMNVFNLKTPTNGLITDSKQLSSNCAWNSTCSVATLIDGKSNSYFHSTTAMSIYKQEEYLQIKLDSVEVSKFIIEYTGRGDGEELKSALEAVKALYQDRNGLEKLVEKAETLIENTTTGDYFGQLEDETLLESLEEAANAAKVTTSSTEEFKTLWSNLENGIEAVYDGIINNIRKALVEAKETVDVYTVDGVLVKRNVKAAKATAGLPKDIYIVGKNKVLVK